MSRKIRVTDELEKRAEEVFAKAKKTMIVAGKGLTRRELRALERKGVVERISIHQTAKYVGETGAMQYAYRLVSSYQELIHRGE